MSRDKNQVPAEQGVDIPYQQLDPQTLCRLIQEFVSRDGADWGDAGGSLEEKVAQVMQQLRDKQVKLVYDLATQTANLVACRRD
jgi:uncharacterized protein